MSDIKIESKFKDLLPPLSEEQKVELEKDIIEKGCLNPLIVWNKILIDGHHRHEICTRNNIPFDLTEMEFKDELEAMEWAWSNQKNRRNLNKYELSQIALKFKPVIEAKAKENQLATLKQNTVLTNSSKRTNKDSDSFLTNSSKTENTTPINTRKEIAKIAGVSEDTIHKVEVIEEKAPEEVKQQVKKGELTINSAYVLTKSAVEAEKKNKELQQQYEEQLKNEEQDREEKEKLKDIEESLPENAVILDKFRKPKEIHIFGIEDFNNLTQNQLDECIKHSKRYQEAISKIALLNVDEDSLKAWNCVSDTVEMIDIELQDINMAIQKLVAIQNFFKGVRK